MPIMYIVVVQRSERVARRERAVDNTLIARLAAEENPQELGGTSLRDVLTHRLRIGWRSCWIKTVRNPTVRSGPGDGHSSSVCRTATACATRKPKLPVSTTKRRSRSPNGDLRVCGAGGHEALNAGCDVVHG